MGLGDGEAYLNKRDGCGPPLRISAPGRRRCDFTVGNEAMAILAEKVKSPIHQWVSQSCIKSILLGNTFLNK